MNRTQMQEAIAAESLQEGFTKLAALKVQVRLYADLMQRLVSLRKSFGDTKIHWPTSTLAATDERYDSNSALCEWCFEQSFDGNGTYAVYECSKCPLRTNGQTTCSPYSRSGQVISGLKAIGTELAYAKRKTQAMLDFLGVEIVKEAKKQNRWTDSLRDFLFARGALPLDY